MIFHCLLTRTFQKVPLKSSRTSRNFSKNKSSFSFLFGTLFKWHTTQIDEKTGFQAMSIQFSKILFPLISRKSIFVSLFLLCTLFDMPLFLLCTLYTAQTWDKMKLSRDQGRRILPKNWIDTPWNAVFWSIWVVCHVKSVPDKNEQSCFGSSSRF